MINFKSLLETVYQPKSGDEKNFKDKHIVAKYKTPYDTESQFTSNKPKAKRKADHDTGEDEAVYEAAAVHTKRADKEAVIVRGVDPKTGESKAKVVQRRAGEIKIGEEVEELDELSKKTLGSYIKKSADDVGYIQGDISRVGTKAPEYKGLSRSRKNRKAGIAKAVSRLTKEENELDEGVDKLSNARLKFHATKNFPHGSYTRKEIQDEHKRRMRVEPNYHTVKPALSEDLDEKVSNPYAIGMAAAMKSTGDRPPLKKSTIVKGHEIAKSIKNEAMDKVGKEDSDIDNDGDTDKSDKYLHNRRKAIGKALRKEEAEQIDELSKKTLGSYIKKANDDTYLAGKFARTDPHAKRVGNNHKVGVKRAVDRLTKEEVDQLDELSPNTLHKYIKKATPDVAARAISAVAPNQSSETKKHASKLGKRIAGITSASGRLSDKANQNEEVEQIDELSKKTLGSYVKKASADAVEKRMKADRLNTAAWTGNKSNDEFNALDKASTKAYKSHHNRLKGIDKATDRITKEEVEMIDEAVKVGAMKLHDGATVNVTRAMADSLNSVFEQLNPMNRVKMEQKLHSSKKDFDEILKFAENVNG